MISYMHAKLNINYTFYSVGKLVRVEDTDYAAQLSLSNNDDFFGKVVDDNMFCSYYNYYNLSV